MVRFIPKQFAENSTTSVVFGSFQEQGGNVGDGTISSDPATLQGGTAWPLGWSAATDNFFKIPRGEEMEGLERVLSAAIIQQFKDGLTFWQSEMPVTQYQTIVQYQTGSDLPKLYVNITGTSTSTPPDSDTINWFMFCDTAQVLANVSLTNSPYTTNRILEIPQDIKLKLNNGTLTLKAGSKVYVPNGFEEDGTTPKFDVVTIENDLTMTTPPPTTSGKGLLFIRDNGTSGIAYDIDICSTGTTDAGNNTVRYRTDTNFIVRTVGGGAKSNYSFPIALINMSGTTYVSIDQIFNGFGYIGSTVFALPGIKFRSPDGKNSNGTYKTVERTINNVKTYNAGPWTTHNLNIFISGSESSPIFECQAVERFTYNKTFSSDTSTYSFDENTNMWWYSSNQTSWTKFYGNIVGACRVESGRITQFQVETVDSVANSNASNFSQAGRSYLSGLGMPSGKYIDLTLGASGATYTAPANGKFCIYKVHGANTSVEYITMSCNGRNKIVQCDYNKYHMTNEIEVSKGDVVLIGYTVTGSTTYFRFYYAEGEV